MIPKFKNNEKVFCIKVDDNNILHLNDIYCLVGDTTDEIIKICADKKYINDSVYYFIIDKNGYEYSQMFKEDCFISIKKYRNEKLNKIMRKKIPEDKKRVNANITIDKELLSILEEYLEDNNISNKSKYIENLIREDFQKKGKNIDRKF